MRLVINNERVLLLPLLLFIVLSLILILTSLLYSAKTAGSTGRNQTNLTTRRTFTSNRGRLTNVLVVTTTVGMLYWILRHTTNLGPAVALDRVLVVSTSSLQERLIGTTTSSNDSNLSTGQRTDGLLTTTGKTETSGSLVLIVGDNDGKGSTTTSIGTTISKLGLDVAHNGSFGHTAQRKDISNCQSGLLSAIYKLTRVHAFRAHQKLGVFLVTVGISELDLADGSSTTGIVKDFLHDATNVSVLFGVVKGTKLHGSLASPNMGLEDGGLSLTLGLRMEYNVRRKSDQ